MITVAIVLAIILCIVGAIYYAVTNPKDAAKSLLKGLAPLLPLLALLAAATTET